MFYSCGNLLDMAHRLGENKLPIMHVNCVGYICFEIEKVTKKRGKKKILKENSEKHEEIMAIL